MYFRHEKGSNRLQNVSKFHTTMPRSRGRLAPHFTSLGQAATQYCQAMPTFDGRRAGSAGSRPRQQQRNDPRRFDLGDLVTVRADSSGGAQQHTACLFSKTCTDSVAELLQRACNDLQRKFPTSLGKQHPNAFNTFL